MQYPFPFAIGNDKMAVPFRADNFWHFGLVGRLGLEVGVKTSLVTDSENDKIEGENFLVK